MKLISRLLMLAGLAILLRLDHADDHCCDVVAQVSNVCPAVQVGNLCQPAATTAAPGAPPIATSQPASRPETVAGATTAPADRIRRVHGFVSGRVQGVSFRAFTAGAAGRLKVTGWVRNLADSRVEFLAEGRADAIEKLLAAVRAGPSAARVEKVQVADESPSPGEFKEFEVRP